MWKCVKLPPLQTKVDKYSLNFGASIKSPFMELQVLLPLTFLDEGKTNFEQDKVAHPEHTAGWSVWSSLGTPSMSA